MADEPVRQKIFERLEYPYVTPEEAWGVATFGDTRSIPIAGLDTTWFHYHHGESFTRRGWIAYTEKYGPHSIGVELMVLVDPHGRYALILRPLWENCVGMLRIADWVVDHGWPTDWRIHEGHHQAQVREAWQRVTLGETLREPVKEFITKNGIHS